MSLSNKLPQFPSPIFSKYLSTCTLTCSHELRNYFRCILLNWLTQFSCLCDPERVPRRSHHLDIQFRNRTRKTHIKNTFPSRKDGCLPIIANSSNLSFKYRQRKFSVALLTSFKRLRPSILLVPIRTVYFYFPTLNSRNSQCQPHRS